MEPLTLGALAVVGLGLLYAAFGHKPAPTASHAVQASYSMGTAPAPNPGTIQNPGHTLIQDFRNLGQSGAGAHLGKAMGLVEALKFAEDVAHAASLIKASSPLATPAPAPATPSTPTPSPSPNP